MTLQLYILRQLFISTTFAVGALGFVVFPAIAVSAVHKLGGVSLGVVLRYIPMIGIELAPYLVSLGFLLAIVSTFGRLAGDKEWIAINMAGIHPLRMLLPGVLIAAVLGAGTYVLLSTVSPVWKYEQSNYRANALLESFRNLSPGRTELDFGKFYLASVEREDDWFIDVQIRIGAERDSKVEDFFVVADRAHLAVTERTLAIRLIRYSSLGEDQKMSNEEIKFQFLLDELFERRQKDANRAKYKTSSSLLSALLDGSAEVERVPEYRFELHRRFAVAGTYLVFLLVGIPTGLWLQSGQQLAGLGMAALYAFVYYVLSLRLGRELALEGVLPPALAAWTTNILGAVIGVIALWRAVRR